MFKSLIIGLLLLGPVLPGPRPAAADEPARTVGAWDSESGLGNHRALVRVALTPSAAKRSPRPRAAHVVIPWRRHDLDPDKKALIVIDAATGVRLANVIPFKVNREFGEIYFEAPTLPGDYYVYFMPYKSEGRKNYPNVKYDSAAETFDPDWEVAERLRTTTLTANDRSNPPWIEAEAVEIQSVDEFNSFAPMEAIATAAETAALLDAHPGLPYLVFPEDRRRSIRMTGDLPYRWIQTGPASRFEAEAAPGEYFTFQLGLWAARAETPGVTVTFTDFVRGESASESVIPASSAACFNTGGIGWDASPFTKSLTVPKGGIQPLWCGLQVPADAPPGRYTGTVTISPLGLPPSPVRVSLLVAGPPLPDAGDSDPFRMTRLRWLDSRLAVDDGIVPPYTPLEVEGTTLHILGRTLTVGPDGLPAGIRSFFAPEMTRLSRAPLDVTASPFKFRVLAADGREIPLAPVSPSPRITKKAAGIVAWEASSRSSDASPAAGLTLSVSASLEFDGFADYKLALTAARDTDVSDILLEVPLNPAAACYMMGLGFKGGERPATFDWSWDRKKNQDALWLGAVNGGLQVSLRAGNYSRPLNTNFYLSKPLNLPPSWSNGGRGTVSVRAIPSSSAASPSAVLLTARSGPRTLHAGETLHFDFTLLLTPFKPLDPAAHFAERYYHAFKPLDEIAASGANVINVHHATEINPYINYPFLRPAAMKAYIEDAHRRGFKVKIYDTIRELSNRAPELFALRSLGHEIFSPGPGGGFSWLQEHLGSDYIAAWFVPELKDAAIINSGMSRWHNYYVEGLDWLARNVGIDGLYLDDVAFDRTTMKRVRKVLDRNRPGALIDLHSANQYNPRDGFASSANLYLEHFPYLNRLWFGEYFDYNSSGPDYWLVEMSGIPFGLMGEMLQDGGNPWRGMVFGMTSRLPWAGDPRPLWKVWDEFGITSSEMIGWWAESNPVRTGNKAVLATTYVNGGRNRGRSALIALAGWAKEPADVRLTIDWKALGLDKRKAVLRAPAIEKFQPAAEFAPADLVRVEPGQGWLLVLEEKRPRPKT